MTVRQRIVLLIALTFAALAGIGGYALYQSYQGAHEVRSVTEGVVPSTIQSVELVGQLKDIQIATLSMVSAPDASLAAQQYEALRARRTALEQALNAQSQQADNAAQRGLIEEARQSLRNYFAAIDDTARFKLSGEQEAAEATMAATVDQYLREQGQMIEAVQVEKRRSKDHAIEALNQNLRHTSATLAIITLAAVAALALIGVLLYRQVIHPIAEMERKMTAIAGSQDFTHRLSVVRHDEIGRSALAFNAMIEKIEESSALVRQKSADIQALLHDLPQGILTLEAGGRIHPEYSRHLTLLLGQDDLAGRSVADTVFAAANLSADSLDQTLAALDACIGEDAMNFAFNAHLLPHEITLMPAEGPARTWELGWSPITGEDQIITRILLSIRDVTELRTLAQASRAQQRELAMIGEILALERGKFVACLASSQGFVEANMSLLQHAEGAPAERANTTAALFRNMHTLKGNARTYGLLHLADAAHMAEQRYDALRQNPRAWDLPTLQADLQAVQQALQNYQRTATRLQGHAGQPSAATGAPHSDQATLSRPQAHALAAQLDLALNDREPSALRATAAQVSQALHTASAVPLAQALRDAISSLPALAQALGKPAPAVDFAPQGLSVAPPAADMLHHVFTHLLGNALDHGIESAAEREAHGKPAAGRITIAAHHTGQQLALQLRDDGRGLNLERIRTRALSTGLLTEDSARDDMAVAQAIFAPGFSTAASITAVSGRGVGMDAVQAFVADHGGDVVLTLHEAMQPGFRAFALGIALPQRPLHATA
jgi:two-component system chemotaxis sensor kinase CheA